MELSLRHIIYSVIDWSNQVSILVLMELSLRRHGKNILMLMKKSFNPCFNGTLFETREPVSEDGSITGFNPCFNGTLFETVLI